MSTPRSGSNGAELRHALYYPFIHIRDENWLKGAILGFQQVRRIVPQKFTVKDEDITEPYARLEGPAGPLLEPEYVNHPEMCETQTWLRKKIEAHMPELKAKYNETEARRTLLDKADDFQIHSGKFVDPDFVQLLKKEQLAWSSRDFSDLDAINWLTMHPKFGSGVMSVLALTVARMRGLSVLTPSSDLHHELLANREETVFEKLVEVPKPASGPDSDVTVEELSHVVITMGFDLTRLQPEDIAELLKEGKDLRRFRVAAATFAANIPSDVQGEERVRRIRQEAQALLDEWREYSDGLPKFAKDTLIDTSAEKGPEKLLEAGIEGAAAGAVAGTLIGAVPGLLLSIAVSAGVKMFRRPDTPLRFLSKVNKMAEKRIGSIYVPQWRALAAQSA